MPLAQAVTAEPPPPARTVAGKGEPLDLSKETFSIAEAARFLGYTENVLRLFCRKGAIPSYQSGSELRIKRDDLIAYYHEEKAEMERYLNSPFARAMSEIEGELMKQGIY